MKKKLFSFVLFLMISFILPKGVFPAEDWKIIGFSSKGTFFYHPEKKVEIASGGIKLWVKFVYNEEGKKMLRQVGGDMARAEYVLILYEIDCQESKANCQSFILYSAGNESLGAIDCRSKKSEVPRIFPESSARTILREKFCP